MSLKSECNILLLNGPILCPKTRCMFPFYVGNSLRSRSLDLHNVTA